jgi:AbiV family abortive infection protein
MPRYDSTTLKEASIKALSNSRDLYADAEMLAEEGSISRALSLHILSREEAQKAILLTYCAVGVYDTSESLVGREIKRALIDHNYKHEAAWYVSVFSNYILEVIARYAATRSEKEIDVEDVSKEAIDRLKRIASPKNKKLEQLKWRGLYVGIDDTGFVTHPGDITHSEYNDVKGLAAEHYLYAKVLHSNIINANPDVVANYKLQADQFKLLTEMKPLKSKIIDQLEQEGKLNPVMAGFGRYLIQHELIL